MIYAILCPGPSLANLAAKPAADVTIAVNRAALRFACDVWAAMDYPMIRKNVGAVLGEPIILTRRQTWEDVSHRCPRQDVRLVEDIEDVPASLRWQIKTMTCAMVYAFKQGATRIDLWGCDLKGVEDYDGKLAGEDRSDKRWSDEARDLAALIEWMKADGVEVIRHGPDEPTNP